MKGILLVALGGAVGSVARYKLSGYVLQHTIDWRFPAGTFAVNVLGCLVAGILAGLAEKHDFFTQDVRLLLFTGLLGGFTTFSAFSIEIVRMIDRGGAHIAASYALASVVLSVGAAYLGLIIARSFT